jgi:hypothetical protein
MIGTGGQAMNEELAVKPIPLEIAERLCAEIRAEAEEQWHSSASAWCWACQKSTGGKATKRGFLQAPGNRGCILVNARFAAL